ncbi:MAG: TadE/TadG family type IV pilus assembly protein [Pseudomonadota bacterium]
MAHSTRRNLFGLRTRRGFVRSRRGSAAIEFAMVAPVFLALTLSVFEAALYFFISSAVDSASTRAARLIRTGQAQGGAISQDAFFGEICRVVGSFGDCQEQLTVDVQRFNNFTDLAADVAAPVCRDSDPTLGEPDPDTLPYNTGAARDIIRVRICFLYKSFNPAIGFNLESADGGAHKMISTTIFRNEPF